jgi:transglutaminase-like putative cysteine protease/tetratricopeptide (TPR) repeat protein
MVNTRRRLAFRPPFFFVLLVWGALGALGAESPWDGQRFQADPGAFQKVAAENAHPTGDIEVLYDETVAVIDADKRWTKTFYLVYRVLTAKGADNWDSISSSWAPWYQDRPTMEARVLNPDGSVHPLAPETIKESTDGDNSDKVYSDRHHLEAPLPALAVGSIVEERIVVRDTQPFFDAGTVERFSIGNNAATRKTVIRVESPTTQPLLYSLALVPDAKVTKTAANGTAVLTIDQGPLAAWEDYERYLPSDVPRRPAVAFATAPDWHAVALAYSAVVDKKIGPATPALVPAVTGAGGSREEKIGRVIRWMAKEIRYTGIEFGESALVPHTPQETLTRKYGDCKDKATLMVALLRQAGIGAEVALLSSGPGLDTDPTLPGMGAFDHAIVHVSGTPEIWIDPTDDFARPGQLPNGDQGRQALLAAPTTTALVTIPRTPPSANLLLEKREVTLPAYGLGTVKETSQGFGALESSHRDFFAYQQEKERQEWAESYADDEYRTKKVDSIVTTDPNDLTTPFTWTTIVQKTPRADTELYASTLYVRYEHLVERLPEWLRTKPDADAKDRKGSFLLPSPFVTELQLRVVPPEGFVPTVVPSSTTLELGRARLTESFHQGSDGVVTADLKFDTVTDTYTAAEATELRTKILDLFADDPLEFRFEPETQVLLANGKVREAITRGRQLAAQAGVEHRLRYALALQGLGLGDAARAEAKKATDQAPGSALAWQVRGIVLEGDEVGRTLRPGTDWEGARAALTRSKELDPANNTVAGDLAILHEYDGNGARYEASAPLDKAIELYKAVGADALKSAEIQANVPWALFYAGRFTEAAKETAALAEPPLALLVACEALLKSPEAAVALAQRKTTNTNTRSEALRTAGSMLTNLRRYPQAAVLVRAGATGSNATQYNAYASILEKTKPYDAAPADQGDPTTVVRQLFVELIQNTKLTETMKRLLSRTVRNLMGTGTDDSLVGSVGYLTRTLRQQGLLRNTVIDLTMQIVQFRVEGSDAQGWRVLIVAPGARPEGYLVVKEDGQYKVADSTASPGWRGPDLWELVDQGRGDDVRLILDWYRDAMAQGNPEDPESTPPFARFWKKGRPANATDLSLAIALVMTETKETAALGTARLEALRPNLDAPTQHLVDAALLDGYLAQQKFGPAAAIAVALQRAAPTSRSLFLKTISALSQNHQAKELGPLVTEVFRTNPRDPEILGAVATAYAVLGNHDEAERVLNDLVATGQAGAQGWNEAAWNTLFVPGREKDGLELAYKSFQADQNNALSLHTLACLFAVNGQATEAKETMVKAMDLAGADAVDENYRLVQGLLAEGVGLTDVAQDLLSRVSPPATPALIEVSSYRIAQNHLKALSKP